MDRETIEEVRREIKEIADDEGICLDTIIFFGSSVRGDFTENSDIDILLVSADFEGVVWYKRPGVFYRHWDFRKFPEPEIICLTPHEFEKKKRMETNIVREAVGNGVVD